jgi:hypothetical protein
MAQSNGLIDILPPDWICRPNIRGMNQPPDRPHFFIKYRFHYETISRCHIVFTLDFSFTTSKCLECSSLSLPILQAVTSTPSTIQLSCSFLLLISSSRQPVGPLLDIDFFRVLSD